MNVILRSDLKCSAECRPCTLKELKNFGVSNKVGGTKNHIDCRFLFGTTPNDSGRYPARDLKKSFNSIRISWHDPSDIKEKKLFLWGEEE